MDALGKAVALVDWAILWTEIKIITTSVGILYAGAHASLTRPPSAAPRKKLNKHGRLVNRTEDERKDIEGLKNSDAIVFPALAGVVLVSLYYLLQMYPDLVNVVLKWYIAVLSLASLATMYSHGLQLVTGFVMPRVWRGEEGLYVVGVPDEKEESTWNGSKELDKATTRKKCRKSKKPTNFIGYGAGTNNDIIDRPMGPIPLRSPVSLSTSLKNWLWDIRPLLTGKWTFEAMIFTLDERISFPIQHVFGLIGAIFTVWRYQATNSMTASNLIGLAGCYSSMLIISPTTFGTGSLVLSGLFVYDIIMVFFTKFMISVAMNLDVPIKLTVTTGTKKNILGLGDIVVPGMIIGLALRFDLWRHYQRQAKETEVSLTEESQDPATGEVTSVTKMQRSVAKAQYKEATGAWGDWFWTKTWGELLTFRSPSLTPLPDYLIGSSFPKTYFRASIFGYALGLLVTMAVMMWFKHGQPALLYLVPSVLGSVYATAWARGDLKDIFRYTEDGSLDTEEVVVDVGPDGKKIEQEKQKCKTMKAVDGNAKAESETQVDKPGSSRTMPGDVLLLRVSLPEPDDDDD